MFEVLVESLFVVSFLLTFMTLTVGYMGLDSCTGALCSPLWLAGYFI